MPMPTFNTWDDLLSKTAIELILLVIVSRVISPSHVPGQLGYLYFYLYY